MLIVSTFDFRHACSDDSQPEDYVEIGGWITTDRCPSQDTALGRNTEDQRKNPGDRQLNRHYETKPSTNNTPAEKQETRMTDNNSAVYIWQKDKDDPWTPLKFKK